MIKVMATAAIQEAYLELVPEFERATGNKVVTLWAPTVDVMSRIKEGEMVDLVIMAAGSVDTIFDGLGKMSVLELVELKKRIEDESETV